MALKIAKRIRSIKRKMGDHRYHRFHEQEALKRRRQVELRNGKTPPRLIHRADEYAREVLGWVGYASWLHTYAALAREFREGWIPDEYYARVVVPALSGRHGLTLSSKTVSRKLLGTDAFPDIGYFVNGLFYDADYAPIGKDDFVHSLFAASEAVVFKREISMRGLGVSVLERHNFDDEWRPSLGNGVFQKYIRQHEFFDRITPSSVATLRITTALSHAGDISPRGAFLRVALAGKRFITADEIGVPVDVDSGELTDLGYFSDWSVTNRHPDTKFIFAGHSIPEFQACVETCVRLHGRFSYVRCIGWDVVVDDAGCVQVLEANAWHNDVKFSEATQGPCFADLGWDGLWKLQEPWIWQG